MDKEGAWMKTIRILCPGLVVLGLVISLAVPLEPLLAQSGGGFDLEWSTVDGGGGQLAGGGLRLVGTAGQPDAAVTLKGGDYALNGGFWSGPGVTKYEVYLPVVIRH
jgi:hypothetical protein